MSASSLDTIQASTVATGRRSGRQPGAPPGGGDGGTGQGHAAVAPGAEPAVNATGSRNAANSPDAADLVAGLVARFDVQIAKIGEERAALARQEAGFEKRKAEYDRALAELYLRLRDLRGRAAAAVAAEWGARLFNDGIDELAVATGDPFDARRHEPVARFVGTPDATLNNHVAAVIRPGIVRVDDGVVLVPARVQVFKFDSTAKDNKRNR